MKAKTILLIISALILLSCAVTGQTRPNGHDSDVVNSVVNGAIHTGEVITGHAPLIPFIPDSILGGIVSSIVFSIWRIIEKRKLRKAGKLKDRPEDI